ncbi:MAG TPA: hypothetical protein VFQ50_05645 [Flavobacterium sp.]|jgi:hypothetical protein|nr:hypothetical protein [Flavobacterium sp.]
MKNLLIAALLLFALSTNAQLTETSASKAVKEVTTIGSFSTTMQASQAKLTSTTTGSEKTFTLKYRQNGSKPEQSIVFNGTDATINSLYDIFKSFFTAENKANINYMRTFTLGDKEVVCKAFKNVTPLVQVSTEDGTFYINESQVDKLFGKK